MEPTIDRLAKEIFDSVAMDTLKADFINSVRSALRVAYLAGKDEREKEMRL